MTTTVTIKNGEAIEGVATFDEIGLKRAGPPWLDDIDSFTALRSWARRSKRTLVIQGGETIHPPEKKRKSHDGEFFGDKLGDPEA